MEEGSTVHYGLLSKAVLGATREFNDDEGAWIGGCKSQSIQALSNHIQTVLTGGSEREAEDISEEGRLGQRIPVLDKKMISSLNVEIMLPKASLTGRGVGLYRKVVFGEGGRCDGSGMSLKLYDLKVSAVIGVNPNERLAKQTVIANIEIDRWTSNQDEYSRLEELVVKVIVLSEARNNELIVLQTIEESSFQTLEALANHLGKRIIMHFIIPWSVSDPKKKDVYPRIRISLGKPIAVTFADAPAIEVLLDSNPRINESVAKLWEIDDISWLPPFPLQGRLDEWIKESSSK